MRSWTDAELEGRCRRCELTSRWCLCGCIPSVHSRTRVLLLRHAAERKKTSNTARLAATALCNGFMYDHGLPGAPLDVGPLLGPDPWLLFPGPGARALDGPWLDRPPPHTLVVLDGTWKQARRMSQHLAALAPLPRAMVGGRPTDSLRSQHLADGMPTLVAVGQALSALEGPAVGEPLVALHAEFVRRVRLQRGY